jgi:uncharacterized protein YhbP (UPF0306 family)
MNKNEEEEIYIHAFFYPFLTNKVLFYFLVHDK